MNFMTFHMLGIIIIPTDELIFFRGVGVPPTRIIMPTSYRFDILGILYTLLKIGSCRGHVSQEDSVPGKGGFLCGEMLRLSMFCVSDRNYNML